MCSKASEPLGRTPASRCLLCNVGCPVRILESGPDQYLPDYVPHDGYAGLCGRGSVLVELLDHEDRFAEAHRQTRAGSEILDTQTAARHVAKALRSASSAALIIDGNFDADTLAAAGRFARDCDARWSVLVPPGDAGLVRALDSGPCRFIGPEALEDSDAVLLVGDIFATHPVAAHWVFAARARNPRMPLLVVADAACATAGFATDLYEPDLEDGGAAVLVAAIRTGQASGTAHLENAEAPAIVVGADFGYVSALRVGLEVARLAEAVGAAVLPLTTYGNAWGAMRAANAADAVPVEDILKHPPEALLVIGADVEAALAPKQVAQALDAVRTLMYAGPMPNATSQRAGLVLATGFAFEDSGRALLGPGREVQSEPLLAPPAGVPTVRQMLRMAGAPEEAQADLSAPVPSAEPPPRAEAVPPGAGIILALAGDPIHFADGSLTRPATWPQAVVPRPVLVMAQADAKAAGLTDADRAVVEGPGGAAEVVVTTDVRQRRGQARVSAAFPEVRDVFGWKIEGPQAYEPTRARVRKA